MKLFIEISKYVRMTSCIIYNVKLDHTWLGYSVGIPNNEGRNTKTK